MEQYVTNGRRYVVAHATGYSKSGLKRSRKRESREKGISLREKKIILAGKVCYKQKTLYFALEIALISAIGGHTSQEVPGLGTGCSAVRLAHLLWEQGSGSNPALPPTKKPPEKTSRAEAPEKEVENQLR